MPKRKRYNIVRPSKLTAGGQRPVLPDISSGRAEWRFDGDEGEPVFGEVSRKNLQRRYVVC